MQLEKWQGDLIVRLPREVISALDLKEGEPVDITVSRPGALEIRPRRDHSDLWSKVRALRGRLPATYVFNRDEAYERSKDIPGQ